MSWLALGALAKRVITSVITWLTHASFWQLVSLALACFALVQHFQLVGERRHSAKLQAQLTKIAEQSKVKKEEVTRTVDRYITVTKPVIEKEVERIETAPLLGNCKTPQAVMDADI